MKKTEKAKLHGECTFPRGITYPAWPAFDLSVQFNERDPAYADGHVRALAWRKVWQAIKEILKVFCLILKDSAFALNQFRPDITA